MNEKPFKLDMEFGEALARLAAVPRASSATTATTLPKNKHKKAAKSADKPAKNPRQQG